MSAKAKKGVSKEELRRLMKQQKSEGTISHPLAKYPFLFSNKSDFFAKHSKLM